MLLFFLIITSFSFRFVSFHFISITNTTITFTAGRTGRLVFSLLMKNSLYYPVGLVRTETSAKKLIKQVECGLENIWVCDVTCLDPNGEANDNGLPNGLTDAQAMIICTSAVPKMKKRSLARAFLKMPFNVVRGRKAFNFRELQFRYADGQHPEKVDYEGQIAQIDLAKKLGISHVVLVSSMGGTNPDDFLNKLGKDEDGQGKGDILIWKRKAEKYLVDSGLHYTIIHPGGLKDTPGGEMNLDLDVDDNLKSRKPIMPTSISRCDVARLCIASLSVSNGQSAAFDCSSSEVPEGSKRKHVEETLKDFLASGKKYDYSDMDVFDEDYSI